MGNLEGPTRSTVFWMGLLFYGLAQTAWGWLRWVVFGRWRWWQTVGFALLVMLAALYKVGLV